MLCGFDQGAPFRKTCVNIAQLNLFTYYIFALIYVSNKKGHIKRRV